MLARERGMRIVELTDPSNPEKVRTAPSPLDAVLGLVPLCSSCPFGSWPFFQFPGADNSAPGPSVLSLPTAVHSVGWGALGDCVSTSPAVLDVVSVSCCVEAV